MSTPTSTVGVDAQRLRRSRDITRVLRGRQQRGGRFAVVFAAGRADARPARVAVVASRKVGTAVARNRAKRLLREAARGVDWRPGCDVVLVARRACADTGMGAVAAEVATSAGELGVGRARS